MTFEQRPEGERINLSSIQGTGVPHRGKSQCKGPKVGVCLMCWGQQSLHWLLEGCKAVWVIGEEGVKAQLGILSLKYLLDM